MTATHDVTTQVTPLGWVDSDVTLWSRVRSLLSVSADAKTIKGEKQGFLTGILYLAPHTMGHDGHNLCPFATPGCSGGCLYSAGRGKFSSVQTSRLAKRAWFFADRPGFLEALRRDIRKLVKTARRLGLRPCVRLNGTSDVVWEHLDRQLFAEFPEVTFYDYTKIAARFGRPLPENYSLTFSRSERNDADALRLLASGHTVAVVFDTKRGQPLPTQWWGYPVVDGDLSDLRFLDPKQSVIGLRAKGDAKGDASGFVVGCGR